MRLTYKLEKPIITTYLHFDYVRIDDYDISKGNYGKITQDEIYNKLGQLEDIEEELGIDLITLFKALNSKELWWKTKTYGLVKTTFQSEGLRPEVGYDTAFDKKWSLSLCWHALADDELLSNYGKTWALDKNDLTKEELGENIGEK